MVDVVCDPRITHQIRSLFGRTEARNCERTGASLEYEEFGELAAREGSHMDELFHGMRTAIREHGRDVNEALSSQGEAVRTRCRITFVLMIAVIFVTGCGIHLHRPQDAQLARNASAAFKDAKLTEALKGEFDAAAEMLKDEVAAIRRQSNARRDRLLSAIIGGQNDVESWGRIVDYADRRLEELLGPKEDANWPGLNDWIKARKDTYERFDTVREGYLVYEGLRKSTDPRIPRIGVRLSEKEESALTEAAKDAYRHYKEQLAEYDKAAKRANTPPSGKGIVGSIAESLDNQEKNLREASEAAKKVKADLERLKKERENKIAEAKAPGKKGDEISKALKEAADKTNAAKKILQGLLDAAAKRGLTGVQEKITAFEEIREQISDLLPATADAVAGKKPEPGDSEKIKLLASLTAIRAAVDGAAYPRVSDLILESERLRIELDRLRGLIALEEERKALLDHQLTALSREIVALSRAKARVISEVKVPRGVLALENDAINQELAADALACIAESWSVGRTPAEEIDFLIFGIDHRVALENSSAAFAQWSNLIGVPLSQLVAYHESGIKPEDLANLINAAGLSAIAARVQ